MSSRNATAECRIPIRILGIEHEVNVSAFTVDRTLLSDSLLTSRGLSKLDDGGAGNSDGISSVAMSLDGCLGVAPRDC